MTDTKLQWAVDVVKEDVPKEIGTGKDEKAVLFGALNAFFEICGFTLSKDQEKKEFPLFTGGKDCKRLLVIPSNCPEGVLGYYFKELLHIAYGSETCNWEFQRYVFVELDHSNRFFNALGSILERFKIGIRVKVDEMFSIFSSTLLEEGKQHLDSRYLRHSIEETCFPSGVEEMREFFFKAQTTSIIHDLLKLFPEVLGSALRILVGAYLSGDINFEVLDIVLKAFYPGGNYEKEIIPLTGELSKCIADHIHEIANQFQNPLWMYLENREVLIVEDRLERGNAGWEGWDILLPAIFLPPDIYVNAVKLKNISPFELFKKMQKEGSEFSLKLAHRNNVGELLTDKLDLEKFDLILLDLFSSLGHESAILPSNMRHPMWRFIEKMNSIRNAHAFPAPFPQVVVFSRHSKGITTRTMFKELSAVDYFFKELDEDNHKSGYYSSFRNAIISAFKETVLHVSGLTGNASRFHFNDWFRQFDPCDRAVILSLMKHFKYFSAENIMEIFDRYLDRNTHWDKENKRVSILSLKPRKPSRYIISYLGRATKSGPATLPLLTKTKWIRKLRKKIDSLNTEGPPKFLSYDDLQQEVVADILAKDENEDYLCLIFIDDYVGSGGQIDDYIKKFVDRDLREFCRSLFPKSSRGKKLWSRIENAFNREQPNGIEIHVLFALGINNPEFWTRIGKPEPENKRYKDEKPIFRTILGKISKDIEKETGNGKQSEKKEKAEVFFVDAHIHVVNFTKSIKEILDNDDLLKSVKRTLEKYSVIIKYRSEDCACEFEPLGWKENGALTATYANAQGNTIPVIWRDYTEDQLLTSEPFAKEWKALYKRYFNPLTPEKEMNYKKKELTCVKGEGEGEGKKKKCKLNSKWDKKFLNDDYWETYKKPPCKLEPEELEALTKA